MEERKRRQVVFIRLHKSLVGCLYHGLRGPRETRTHTYPSRASFVSRRPPVAHRPRAHSTLMNSFFTLLRHLELVGYAAAIHPSGKLRSICRSRTRRRRRADPGGNHNLTLCSLPGLFHRKIPFFFTRMSRRSICYLNIFFYFLASSAVAIINHIELEAARCNSFFTVLAITTFSFENETCVFRPAMCLFALALVHVGFWRRKRGQAWSNPFPSKVPRLYLFIVWGCFSFRVY
jgi:hypothetical protein